MIKRICKVFLTVWFYPRLNSNTVVLGCSVMQLGESFNVLEEYCGPSNYMVLKPRRRNSHHCQIQLQINKKDLNLSNFYMS
jgi:hypothetical protein